MRITKALCLELLKAATMQRWNDKLRPLELLELDKQAHKMIIAFFLGKFHESEPGFDWNRIIRGGFYEFLQRVVVTDLKPQIFDRIRQDQKKYADLNHWVSTKLKPVLDPLGRSLSASFEDYFLTSDPQEINHRILDAAHFYATRWEFEIIARENPNDYELDAIKQDLQAKQSRHNQLASMRILSDHIRYQNFIRLCGQLRFQIRWSGTHRVPRTSVLGHMFIVALLAYLFSLQLGHAPGRCANNYFTGLFHDLPEALTRDIISPIKNSIAGLDELIKGFEQSEMEKVYQLLPEEPDLRAEIRRFTEHEFEDLLEGGQVVRDGAVVRLADKFAAYLEAYEAVRNGNPSQELRDYLQFTRQAYLNHPLTQPLSLPDLFAEFEAPDRAGSPAA